MLQYQKKDFDGAVKMKYGSTKQIFDKKRISWIFIYGEGNINLF